MALTMVPPAPPPPPPGPPGPPARSGAEAIAELRALVAEVAALDVSSMSGGQAGEVAQSLRVLAQRLDAKAIEALGQVEASGAWAVDGSRSAPAWLARATRAARGAAAADFRLARALREVLPLTNAAVQAGTIPVEHARAIARECTRTQLMRATLADERRGEALLLRHAGLGLEDFRLACKAWAYRADPDSADARYREDRPGYWFAMATTSDGVALKGFMTPADGEALAVALRARMGVPAKDDPRSHGQRMHDALASIVAGALNHGDLPKTHGVRPQVVVHVPLDTLLAAPGSTGQVPAWLQESRTPLPRGVLERIACDSDLIAAVIDRDGQILRFGRAKRLFDGPLRRALETRDGGCRYPGCLAPAWMTQGHHRYRFADGCPTNLEEGLLVCDPHHDDIHANDITIEHAPHGGLAFYDRHGNHIGTTYPRAGPDPDPLPWPR